MKRGEDRRRQSNRQSRERKKKEKVGEERAREECGWTLSIPNSASVQPKKLYEVATRYIN